MSDVAGRPLTYDADSHVRSFTSGSITYIYSYDGDGRRVRRDFNDGSLHTTVYVYDATGLMLAEYTSDTVVPVPPADAISYLTSDQLGSPRVVTRADGSVKARHDYLPFGEDVASNISGRSTVTGYASQDGLRQKFTSKERDVESGLDFFGERYYSGAQGRFTSVDPLMASAKTGNPPTWNRFIYVLNNPLRYVDLDGLAEKTAWEQFTDEERKILASKLVTVKNVGKISDAEFKAAGQAFNELFEGLSAEQVATGVTGFKNFIDNLGGHGGHLAGQGSDAWQQISHIEKFWLGENNSIGIQFKVEDAGSFLETLSASGFAVDALKEILNPESHQHSARFITDSPYETSMHIVQQDDYANDLFDVHWDKRSVEFPSMMLEGGKATVDQIESGLSHIFGTPISTQQVRQQLKMKGMTPKNEP